MKKFASICLITENLPRLRHFYQQILEIAPEGNDEFVAFSGPRINLSIFSVAGLEKMVPGLMKDTGAGNCFLEFEVADIDQEYQHLQTLTAEIIKPPTTQPWGLRSVWFLDPDGNQINFFATVSGQ